MKHLKYDRNQSLTGTYQIHMPHVAPDIVSDVEDGGAVETSGAPC